MMWSPVIAFIEEATILGLIEEKEKELEELKDKLNYYRSLQGKEMI